MASISTDKKGNRRLQFTAPDKQRKTIRLGRVSKKVAEQIRYHIEEIIAARTANLPLNPATSQWLATLSEKMRGKLAAVGLENQNQVQLGKWLENFTASRNDVKEATKAIWNHTIRNLKDFFGTDKDPRMITFVEADPFRQYLIGLGLKSATVSKRIQNAKMFFRRMAKEKVIAENPFDDVKFYHANDQKQNMIIDRHLYDRIMEAMPDTQWRAVIGLARIGALRCPSEVFSLHWCDIDWAGGWMNVRSPKNEHHPGKAVRRVPLFADLREILSDAFDAAPEGTEHVIWKPEIRNGSQNSRGCWQNGTIRRRLNDFLKRSGIPELTKPFQSMRSSRENEMVEEYPLKCVVDWVGHDIKVAAKHYLNSSDEAYHFKAISGGEKVTQKATHRTTASDRQDLPNPAF